MATTLPPHPSSTKPLVLVDSLLSHSYLHLHPLLLCLLYYVRFPSLTADPVAIQLELLPAVALLQILWCILCLPAYAEKEAAAEDGVVVKKKPKQRVRFVGDRRRDDISWGYKFSTILLSLVLTIVLAFPGTLVLLVLFGAPLTTHVPHTALLAAHFSLLTFLPLFYTHGLDKSTWHLITALHLPIDEVFGGSVGLLAGGWIGAIVIPLDWDRVWQKWPVPILIGGVGGYVIGRGVGMVRGVRGKWIGIGPETETQTQKSIKVL